MNGIHDMGGMQGLGTIGYQASEPMFHEPWEGRVFARYGPCKWAVCDRLSSVFRLRSICA